MPFLQPKQIFGRITAITPAYLEKNGMKALALDVDNTLTAHGSQELPQDIQRWLKEMTAAGVRLEIVSNNTRKRVEPFAAKLGLPFVSLSCKPLPFGFMRVRRRLGLKKSELALVGDQIFTDILGANLYGIAGLMVMPMAKDIKRGILFRRKLEKPVLRGYYKKGGTRIG